MSSTSAIQSSDIRCPDCDKLLVKDGKLKCPRCHTYCDIPTPQELVVIRASQAKDYLEFRAHALAKQAVDYLPASGGNYFFMKVHYPDELVRARTIEILRQRGWEAQIRALGFWERRRAPRDIMYMYGTVPMNMVMTLKPSEGGVA